MFIQNNPQLQFLNIMQLHSPETAVLSTLIFNAIIIPALIPLSLKGVKFKPEPPQKTFLRNMFIYGVGGAIFPFIAIKGIDMLLAVFIYEVKREIWKISEKLEIKVITCSLLRNLVQLLGSLY